MQRGVGVLYNANYAVCPYPYKKRAAGHGDHTGPGAKYIYRHGVYYIEAYGSDKSRLPALDLGQLLPLVVFAYILSLLFSIRKYKGYKHYSEGYPYGDSKHIAIRHIMIPF